MTRINVVPVTELADQHLMAEYRELPRILTVVAKTPEPNYLEGDYRLGEGHVRFFYDKGLYLFTRYCALVAELRVRGFQLNVPDLDWEGFKIMGDYAPTPEAIAINRERLLEKINAKPDWYRWSGKEKPSWVQIRGLQC